jgi:4'-phosphopantetheinyl transferase
MRPLAVTPATVEIWRVHLDRLDHAAAAWLDALPPAEQERARQFRADEPRRRFVAGRAALRQLLGERLRVPPPEIPIVVDERGKPHLAEGTLPRWHFNLSHSGDLVLVALAENGPVGVDVEKVRPLDHWRALATRSFSPAEVCELESLTETERTPAFFAIWTRREAFLKATGAGLAGTLGRELTPGPEWTILEFLAAPDHPAAVAVCHPAAKLVLNDFSPSRITHHGSRSPHAPAPR